LRVDFSGFLQRLVLAGRLGNLIEEQLVRLVEFAAETLVDEVDQARQRNMLLAHHARTHLARPIQRLGVAFVQADRAFADFLQR
jgi:hypothetical protein